MLSPKEVLLRISLIKREWLGPPLIVGVLGPNPWVGLLGLPLWHLQSMGAMSSFALAAAIVALVPLVFGGLLLALRARGAVATLLLGLPLLVLIAIGLQPALVGPSVFSPVVTAIVGISFAAYILGTCWASQHAFARPLSIETTVVERERPRKLKPWPWLLIVFGGLMAFQVMAQGHLSIASFPDESLGSSARWRAAIMSAGALIIWVIAFFGILAPNLRQPHLKPRPIPSKGAAAVWLLVVILAFLMLLISSME